jgi:hypothetical protein
LHIQSTTTPSSSVAAGEAAHANGTTLRPVESISPANPAVLAFIGKYAKKLGLCQCVRPGTMCRRTSSSMTSTESPCSGGASGRSVRRRPGLASDRTGYFSTSR